MKKILFILILSIMLCACTEEENSLTILKSMDETEYIILDVRTKEEYDNSHIKNAINIPYNEIDENVELEKEKTIFVYCKSGGRSSVAYDTLKKLGYSVYDLGAMSEIELSK